MVISKTDQHEFFYGWKNLVLLCLVLSIVSGIIFYSQPVLFKMMARELAWNQNKTAVANTLKSLIVIVLAPLAALCIVKMGVRKTMQVGIISGILACIALGSFITKIWQWYLAWILVIPIASNFSGSLAIQTTINHWFFRRRGTAIAIQTCVAGMLTFFISMLYPVLLNQEQNWRFLWLGGAVLFLLGLWICRYIKNTPQEYNQHPDGDDPKNHSELMTQVTKDYSGVYQTREAWTLKEVFSNRIIWLLVCCMIVHIWTVSMVATHGILHFVDNGMASMKAALVFSIIVISSGIASLPAGILADRIEPKLLTTVAFLGMAVSLIAIWQVPNSMGLLMCCTAIFGFCYGSINTLFLLIKANYFGPQAFPAIQGVLIPIATIFGALTPGLAGYVQVHYGSYNPVFLFLTIMLFVGTVLTWFLVPPQKKVKNIIAE